MSRQATTVADDRDALDQATEEDGVSEPIVVDHDEAKVADSAIERLAEEPNLFHRGGRLVRVLCDPPSTKAARLLERPVEAPRIVPLTRPNLREMLSVHDFERLDGRPCPVPDFAVRAILDRGEWPMLRKLAGVVDHPVLRADGGIFFAVGYDDATELLVRIPDAKRYPKIADAPTLNDAKRARDELLDVVVDFPFAREEHRAAWLAAVLTPFARSAFHGPAPLVAIDKNVRGAGGTLLADTIGVIATGRPMPRMIAAKDAEEERKRITSIALAGDAIVLIDNVAGTLGTDALDAALTATTWSDRKLGTNEMTGALPLAVTWFATGNNLEFGADTLRRVMHVRIESPEERPEERTGYKHDPLLDWVRAERPRLVCAALTLLQAYMLAGRPKVTLAPWGSYEAWSSIVRAAVVWVGLPDPARTREELTTSADAEKNALVDFLKAWRAMFGDAGGTVAQALSAIGDTKPSSKPMTTADLCGGPAADMRAALAELVPTKPGTLPSAAAIGKRLQRHRQRVVGGLALDRMSKSKTGVRWVVRQVSQGDDGDDGDDVSPPPYEKKDINLGSASSPSSPSSPTNGRRTPTKKRSEVGFVVVRGGAR